MMETERADGQAEATETPLVQDADDWIVQLPLGLMIRIAKGGDDNMTALRNEWAVVHWVNAISDEPVDERRKLVVTGFIDRDAAAEWLADMYQDQSRIEAILYQGKPKKFEIEVKAKISLRG